MREKNSYHLAFFVHEVTLSVGHSNAMIETLRHIEHERIKNLYLVCFEHDDPKDLFPDFFEKVKIIKISPKTLYPFLAKVLYFQIISLFVQWFVLPKNCLKLSIGTAILNPDLVNIQFISNQWAPSFFKGKKLSFFSKLYKKILYFFLTAQEDFVYSRGDIPVSVLADFMKNFLQKNYSYEPGRIHKIRSSVDGNRFQIQRENRESLLSSLKENYPQLNTIDFNRPVALFIGAFERKGLHFALDALDNYGDTQIIVIGKGESRGNFNLKRKRVKIAHIPFTRDVVSFYEISDLFIFPTIYEPFGLVILEAAAMGLPLILTSHEVGATELLNHLEQVQVFEKPEDVIVKKFEKISLEQRIKNQKDVNKVLEEYSWNKAGKEFQLVINQALENG